MALARHLPADLRDRSNLWLRPLGADRLGMRLRLEAEDGDYDLHASRSPDRRDPEAAA